MSCVGNDIVLYCSAWASLSMTWSNIGKSVVAVVSIVRYSSISRPPIFARTTAHRPRIRQTLPSLRVLSPVHLASLGLNLRTSQRPCLPALSQYIPYIQLLSVEVDFEAR